MKKLQMEMELEQKKFKMTRKECILLDINGFKASRSWYTAFCARKSIAMKGISCNL